MKKGIKNLFHLFFSASLENHHLLDFSNYFTDKSEFMDLGMKILNLKDYDVERTLTNEGNDIRISTYKILKKWRVWYGDGAKALDDLLQSLKKGGKEKLCTELKKIVGQAHTQGCDIKKQSGLFFFIC